MRRMLFHRDYHGYTGGHGKLRDYIGHVAAHPGWSSAVYLTPQSERTPDNPFLHAPGLTDCWQPGAADVLLLGGMDWAAVPALRPTQPVINLVQHVRHADPALPLRAFLSRRAIRVCVSTAVAEAIRATGEVNGPVRVIPAAVDTALLARLGLTVPHLDVFIGALKQPALGAALATALTAAGLRVCLQTRLLPRAQYLARMAAAAIVVTLPELTEGFYLPGLEALGMGRPLVQYDCLGSRDYLRDGDNALVPSSDVTAMARAVLLVRGDAALRTRLAASARRAAAQFDLVAERGRVHALLDELDDLWRC